MAVSTLLQAFIADEEMFGPEERYAGKELSRYIDENGSHEGSRRHLSARESHHEDDDDNGPAYGKKKVGRKSNAGAAPHAEIVIAKVAV